MLFVDKYLFYKIHFRLWNNTAISHFWNRYIRFMLIIPHCIIRLFLFWITLTLSDKTFSLNELTRKFSILFKMFSLYIRNDNSNNMLGVFRPMYIITRIFGLFPFSVNLANPFVLNQPSLSKVDILIIILHISVYAFYTFLNIYTNTQKYVQLPSVLENGNRVALTGGIFLGIVAVFNDLLNRKNVWNIFQKLEFIDREV